MPSGPRYGPFFYMKIICGQCNKAGQGRYKSFFMESENGKEFVTWCYECLDISPTSHRTSEQMLEHISTPYWQHMGLPPKPKEKAQLKYLKDHNMTWGDLRKARYANVPKRQGPSEFEKHYSKYGRRNAPDARFNKESN